MSHPFDKLTVDNGASFIFTPCPGTKETSVVNALAELKSAGAKGIISLMYDEELIKNNAENIGDVCDRLSLQWFQLPLSDDAAPNDDFGSAVSQSLPDIKAILENKGTLAVHCKGGSGRTGLMIAILLVELGYSKEEAKALVQSIRPKALSKPAQVAYFESY